MSSYSFKDHTPEVLRGLKAAKARIHEAIGLKAEGYAKKLCPVGTVESTGKKGYRGGTLRNSITHASSEENVIVGTNVEYGPYVELGTGPYFEPPPEWEKFTTEKGSGIGHGYVHPRPFLRPAILEHVDEYKKIYEKEMGKE